MAKRQQHSTQVKLPEPIAETPELSQPEQVAQAEWADNSVELTPEEQALAEASLEDDDFDPEGGAEVGEVAPEDEDAPAYEPDVVSEEEAASPDQELAATLAKIKPEQSDQSEQADPTDPTESTGANDPLPDPADPNTPHKPSKRTRVAKTYVPPRTLATDQPTSQVTVLNDGDLMEGFESNQAFPDRLPAADECLAWLQFNELTAAQDPESRTWLVYNQVKHIIGAGGSLHIACHAAGMRAAKLTDDDVENP